MRHAHPVTNGLLWQCRNRVPALTPSHCLLPLLPAEFAVYNYGQLWSDEEQFKFGRRWPRSEGKRAGGEGRPAGREEAADAAETAAAETLESVSVSSVARLSAESAFRPRPCRTIRDLCNRNRCFPELPPSPPHQKSAGLTSAVLYRAAAGRTHVHGLGDKRNEGPAKAYLDSLRIR